MERVDRRAAFTSGELGKATGVSADTIRHYERLGLIAKPARSDGGYRLYDTDALTRVQTIRSAVKAGFTLGELSDIFRKRDAGGIPCQHVAALAEDKLEELDRQIQELLALKEWLTCILDTWRKKLETTPTGKRAGLLDSLREHPPDGNVIRKGDADEDIHHGFHALPHRKPVSATGNGLPDARPTSKGR